eukprot:6205214-Pleurochrysis_carterae.AAC.1
MRFCSSSDGTDETPCTFAVIRQTASPHPIKSAARAEPPKPMADGALGVRTQSASSPLSSHTTTPSAVHT